MQRQNFWGRLKQGEFVVSVQIDPPGTADISNFEKTIQELKNLGVWLVDINSSRRISHDSIQLAMLLSQMGLEVIPHVTTRDSSINGLLNQALAAYAWAKVRNFLVLTGDPYEASGAVVPFKGVFQTDAVGALAAFDEHLRKGPKLKLDLTLAAAVNQNEPNLSREGKRIWQKSQSGADFFMSQPTFNPGQVLQLTKFYRRYLSKPLLVGIWPLIDFATVEKIRRGKIVGVKIPDDVYQQAQKFENEDDLALWGLGGAYELIEFIRKGSYANGVYIVAPLRNPLLIKNLLEKLF